MISKLRHFFFVWSLILGFVCYIVAGIFALMSWSQMFVVTGFVGLNFHIIATLIHTLSETRLYVIQQRQSKNHDCDEVTS